MTLTEMINLYNALTAAEFADALAKIYAYATREDAPAGK